MNEQLQSDIKKDLQKILKKSFPHCKDDNPNEDSFIEINRIAHECLLRLERLSI